MSNRERIHRRATGDRKGRTASVAVEPLEGRALLTVMYPVGYSYPVPASRPPAPATVALRPASPAPGAAATQLAPPVPVAADPQLAPMFPATAPPPTHAAMALRHAQPPRASGIVTKSPRFYQAYTGPKLQELNAVRASGELSSDGTFSFTGTNRGRITEAPAVYVWGIDRSGSLPAGAFKNRPNIKFDAVVVVTLDSSLTPSAQVVDLADGTATDLPAGSSSIRGKTVSVTVPEGLLPSTGLAPSQYRFNYWPEDGGPPTSTSVASFAPENSTARVGSR